MAEGSSPHSQTSSPPGGDKAANEDDRCMETVLFEDTLVLNSPFTEREAQYLNLYTEIVEDSEPAEDVTTGPVCEYEQEVVLDSEDEELDNRDAVTVTRGFLENQTSPKVKNPLMISQKRLYKPPCEQADSNAATFEKSAAGDKGASVDADNFDDNNHLYLSARSNHMQSPEPGDSTQAALGFVDQYLSSNHVDLFQGINCRKTTREKSPLVQSAKGPLNLAKKIKARTRNEEKEPFKWADSDQNDNKAGMFGKENEAPLNFGSYKQTYVRRRQKEGGHLQSQGKCCTNNRCDEKLGPGKRVATENNNLRKALDVQSSAIEGMFDIGLDTQIAAEAMDALAFAHPSGGHFNDLYQPENASDDSLSDLTENEAHLKNSSCRQNSGLHSVTIKSNKKSTSSSRFSKITSSLSCQYGDKQEPNPVSEKMEKLMKSKSTADGQFENNTCSPIFREHLILEEVCSLGEYVTSQSAAEEPKIWNNESRQTRIKDQPSHPTERKNNVKEKGIITRHKRKGNGLVADPMKLGARTKRLKLLTNSCVDFQKSGLNHQAQVSPQLSATSSFSRIDFLVYPKKPRGKRKGANVRINLDVPTVSCIDGKESNIVSIRSLEDQDDVDKSCFPHTRPLCNGSCVDDGKCLLQGSSVQPGLADYAKKTENMHDTHPLLLSHVETSSNKSVAQLKSEIPAAVAASKGISISNVNHTCTEHRKKPCNKNLPKTSLLKELIRLGVPESTSDMHDTHPLLLSHVETSSNKSVAQLKSEIPAAVAASKGINISNVNHTCTEHRKKPCNKNLPKTSLLKELIRLGVPESTSDMMWKDVRHRRDMTDVRVLFSQHLDDSIIKQQKKILARLNISVASGSMEATHFIANKFTRTKNMLETMALGKLIVTHLWLESCGQANCFIDEKKYILRDMKKEKEIGFSMPVSLARARQKPLLKGKRVFITPHVKPDKEVIASLVAAVHGQVVDESQIRAGTNVNSLDDLLILSCEDDYAICHHFLKRGTPLYSSELVLNGIVIQKLELERYDDIWKSLFLHVFIQFLHLNEGRIDPSLSTSEISSPRRALSIGTVYAYAM
ncbi:hypothetical protein VNO77_17952 [Canavalia gladiata]|uniref:BRCT domain-containing protein n=1 Tax=Canavalia gladiata TaxID=3824 RepID=A0AAN9QJ71_CANGL